MILDLPHLLLPTINTLYMCFLRRRRRTGAVANAECGVCVALVDVVAAFVARRRCAFCCSGAVVETADARSDDGGGCVGASATGSRTGRTSAGTGDAVDFDVVDVVSTGEAAALDVGVEHVERAVESGDVVVDGVDCFFAAESSPRNEHGDSGCTGKHCGAAARRAGLLVSVVEGLDNAGDDDAFVFNDAAVAVATFSLSMINVIMRPAVGCKT
jgi:hypothetical protein